MSNGRHRFHLNVDYLTVRSLTPRLEYFQLMRPPILEMFKVQPVTVQHRWARLLNQQNAILPFIVYRARKTNFRFLFKFAEKNGIAVSVFQI
jgi:hypothetical protein